MSNGLQLLEQMRELHLRMHRLFNDRARARGASLAQLKVLMLVERSGSIRSTDIAGALEQAPRTVTEAIDALERDGLVERNPDPADRRAKQITLTEEGRTVCADVAPLREAFATELFLPLSQAQMDEVLQIFGTLNARLDEMGETCAAWEMMPKASPR